MAQKVKATPPPTKALYNVATPETEKAHKGPDTRKGERRSGEERRSELRFEPDKKDRRQNPGRRKDDGGSLKYPRRFWNKT